jgi:hypothetical protein
VATDDSTRASFSIDLDVDGTGEVLGQADALARLRKQLDGDTQALNALQKAMKNLQGGAAVDIVMFKKLEEQITAKKKAIAASTSSILQLGGSLKKAPTGGKAVLSMFEQMQKNANGLGGPLGSLNARLSMLGELVRGGAAALGLVALAAAIAAMTVATVAATAALLKYGLAQADARRNELLRLEGLTKLRNWFGVAAGNASEMQVAIDKVSGSTAIGRGKLAEYTAQLYKMHLRGQNLTDALEAMAIKASVQGEAQAQQFASWAAGAAFAGRSVKKLADDVKARLGGIAARQMLSLGVQSEKLQESFAALFNTLKLEGFLRGLDSLTKLFSQNTATGRALKVLVEGIFQPMIDAAVGAAPIVKRFFQGMVIAALSFGIVVLKVRNFIRDAFGSSEALRGLDMTRLAVWAGVAAFSALLGVVGATAIALGVVVALLAAPFVVAAGLVWGLYKAFNALYTAVAAIDWSGMGKAITDGLVKGVKSGWAYVVSTVKSLAGAVTGTFKDALGIRSPSKVFARLGLAIPQGVEAGVEVGTPRAQRAVNAVVDVPATPRLQLPQPAAPAPTPAAAPPSSSSVSVVIEQLHIHGAGDKPQDFALDLKRELERIFEGLAVSMGAPVPGGA